MGRPRKDNNISSVVLTQRERCRQYYVKNRLELLDKARKYSREHYYYNPQHKRVNRKSYTVMAGSLAHRSIFEARYRCCLLGWGHVHHINGNKRDNRIENLEGMTRSQHSKLHYYGNLGHLSKGGVG